MTLQVYGLLDSAWESYVAFCTEYQAAGRNLQVLVNERRNRSIKPFLAGRQGVQNVKSHCKVRGRQRRPRRKRTTKSSQVKLETTLVSNTQHLLDKKTPHNFAQRTS